MITTCIATTTAPANSFAIILKWEGDNQSNRLDRVTSLAENLLKQMNETETPFEETNLLALEEASQRQADQIEEVRKSVEESSQSLSEIDKTLVPKGNSAWAKSYSSKSSFGTALDYSIKLNSFEGAEKYHGMAIRYITRQAHERDETASKQLLELTSLANRSALLEADCIQVSSHLSSSNALVTSTATTLETKRQIAAQEEAARNARNNVCHHHTNKCVIM